MDLGLSSYQIGDGPLGLRFGASWAHIFADLTEGIPDHADIIADMDAHGLQPVSDVRTTMAHMASLVVGKGDPVERRDAAIRTYAEDILRYVERHPPVLNIEIWGSAECAQFIHGSGELMDYATILAMVFERVKAERPDVRVWTGGFGCAYGATADLTLLERALSTYCPRQFDVCNMHPFLMSTGYLDVDQETVRRRLAKARQTLDHHCAGQPLAATGFGVPTVRADPPPPAYGRFWRRFGRRVLAESEATDWWLGILQTLSEGGMSPVCLLARDVTLAEDSENIPGLTHICGLTRVDGSDKAFTDELCERLKHGPPYDRVYVRGHWHTSSGGRTWVGSHTRRARRESI